MQPTKIEGDCKRCALVRVPFHGDTLDATRDVNGKVWISLRRCCENLGLGLDAQLVKLKGKAWAVITEIVMTGADSKNYSMSAIDLETLPGWLFSIDARKVAEHAREKLAKYQREAARVLAEHFIYGKDGTSAVARSDYETLANRCNELLKLIAWARVELPDHSREAQTLADRLKARGWTHMKPQERDFVTRAANVTIELRLRKAPEKVKGEFVYRGEEIEIVDETIQWLNEELRERRERWRPRLG